LIKDIIKFRSLLVPIIFLLDTDIIQGEIMVLQCTKKILDKLKIKNPVSIDDTKLQGLEAEKWHCNLIKYGRDNAVLITHDLTLFSFFIYGVKAEDFKDFDEVVSQYIFKVLFSLGYEQKKVEIILNSLENISYIKSSNRSTLASMNQIIISIDSFMERDTGDMYLLHKHINNRIYSSIDYDKPFERFDTFLDLQINSII